MKVLIGMTRPDTIASGSFKHVVQVGDRFRKEGVQVAYVIGRSGPVTDYLELCGYKVYKLNFLERDLNPFKDFISLLQLIWTICLFRPTVCSWHTAKIGALGRIASFVTLRKSYYVPHGIPFYESKFNPSHGKYRKLEKILSFLPGKIIGVCDFDTEQYRNLGVSSSKLVTIENGMPEPMPEADEKPAASQPSPVIFKTAARFEDQKDYDTLAKAIIKLYDNYPNFQLHIYGDGKNEGRIKQLFSPLPPGVVIFYDVVKDFSKALDDADVYILSSHWEGLPRTIIEAMSVGLPIIATDVGGVYSLIDEDKNGYLIPSQDDRKFYEALSRYVKQPELISLHGKESKSKYKYRFTLDRMLNEYVDLYLHSRFNQKTVSSADA
ncbi:MAG: glycosyltransferase [Cellvibrionaceae bacterium]|nr:glycosyltransferase [Cellvibrionaceae bacterium]